MTLNAIPYVCNRILEFESFRWNSNDSTSRLKPIGKDNKIDITNVKNATVPNFHSLYELFV